MNIVQSSDLNEDGVFEETYLYNLNGEPIGAQYDNDNNGIIEEMVVILENKDTLKLTDNNGFLELLGLKQFSLKLNK